jgi:hypothetical protein
MNLLDRPMKVSPASCYFLPLRYTFSPQHPAEIVIKFWDTKESVRHVTLHYISLPFRREEEFTTEYKRYSFFVVVSFRMVWGEAEDILWSHCVWFGIVWGGGGLDGRSFPFLVWCPGVRKTCSAHKVGNRVANHPAGYSRDSLKPVILSIGYAYDYPFINVVLYAIPEHRPSSVIIRKLTNVVKN